MKTISGPRFLESTRASRRVLTADAPAPGTRQSAAGCRPSAPAVMPDLTPTVARFSPLNAIYQARFAIIAATAVSKTPPINTCGV